MEKISSKLQKLRLCLHPLNPLILFIYGGGGYGWSLIYTIKSQFKPKLLKQFIFMATISCMWKESSALVQHSGGSAKSTLKAEGQESQEWALFITVQQFPGQWNHNKTWYRMTHRDSGSEKSQRIKERMRLPAHRPSETKWWFCRAHYNLFPLIFRDWV